MKGVVTGVLLMASVAPVHGFEFAVSLSASETDPWVNYVSEMPTGEFRINLWWVCEDSVDPLASVETMLETDLVVNGFEHAEGALALQLGPDHWGIATVCEGSPPVLLGAWLVSAPDSVVDAEFCLSAPFQLPPSCFTTDCTLHSLGDLSGVYGFAVGNLTPCVDDQGCQSPVSLDRNSWGGLKALYRDPSN